MEEAIVNAECGAKGEFIVKVLPELRIEEWQNNLLGKRVLGCASHQILKYLILWLKLNS